MGKTKTLRFADGHPAFAGHFPGAPVVPGAKLLDEAVAAICPSAAVTVRQAKFLRQVGPDEPVTLSWARDGDGERFECRLADGTLAMSGMLAPAPEPV